MTKDREVYDMSYQESKKILDDIRARHDEVVFRMAISHLVDVGIRHLDKESCTKACKEIMSQDDSHALMTNDFMCEIVWLAHELSKVSHIDLLIYIQRYVNWCVCDQLPEDALSDLYSIGFSNDDIEFVGYGNLLEMEN